jgi:hypothetical protein
LPPPTPAPPVVIGQSLPNNCLRVKPPTNAINQRPTWDHPQPIPQLPPHPNPFPKMPPRRRCAYGDVRQRHSGSDQTRLHKRLKDATTPETDATRHASEGRRYAIISSQVE